MKTEFPYFLLLIAIYPVLFLTASNQGEISLIYAAKSVGISVVASLFISGFCLVFASPRTKAYPITVLFNFSFFTYGHFFNLIDGKYIGNFLVGRHMLFLPIFFCIIIAFYLLIISRPPPLRAFTKILNLIFFGLCSLQLALIIFYNLSANSQRGKAETTSSNISQAQTKTNSPDIYYIIIDGLAREDIMKEIGLSEYSLPEELIKRNFYIPQCAFSNYKGTSTSLSSSLNLGYLDSLGVPDAQINNEINDPPVLYSLLHQNRVTEFLQKRGYQFIAFRGFFPLNDFKEADIYFNYFENQQGFDDLSERSFREMFLRTTLLRIPIELYEGFPGKFSFIPKIIVDLFAPESSEFSSRSYYWYRQHMYTFETLATIPSISGKKFTYVHLYTTHQPYVLREDGSMLWPINESNDGYISAAKYTSRRILEVVDQIIRDSASPPVIIIQADHGIGIGLDRYKILNAYFLPGGGESHLYPTITPVNTFRVIFNLYFEQNFDLLPDLIMISKNDVADFVPTPANCNLR